MATWNLRSPKKPTGGKLKRQCKKKKMQRGAEPALTKIGKKKIRFNRMRGGSFKLTLASAEIANVIDHATGKIQKAKILSVFENHANPHFVRRNIITKGAIITTDIGKARVTSRPGQDGAVNAVLIKE
ncbi:MAG: 30S ribosomal protein S8e [Candidatus Aenigmatarchaeota archaeon]